MTERKTAPRLTRRNWIGLGVLAVLVLAAPVLGWMNHRGAAPRADRCLAAARQAGLVGARWNDQAEVLTGYLVQPGVRVPVTASCRLTASGADLQIAR